jgi:hypothetical protein
MGAVLVVPLVADAAASSSARRVTDRLAWLIGWEVSGAVYRSELGRTPEPRRGVLMLLPDERGAA